jgi:leucyl/phenylalanyl-tRNA---protein transferase
MKLSLLNMPLYGKKISMTIYELLDFYCNGAFPMAKSRNDDGFDMVAPLTRALLPIKNFHVPRRLKRTISKSKFDVRYNTDFEQVISSCANAPRALESDTWISDYIISLFMELHEKGIAHSVECWTRDNQLVGGLYGLALGSTFCGESMFSVETDASKIALVHLVSRLKAKSFKILDSQFRNPHLDQFGLYEMPQDEYVAQMQAGLKDRVEF